MAKELSEKYKKYLKTIVSNNGFDVTNLTYEDMLSIYHKIKSNMTKKAHDKWLKSCQARDDTFSSRTKAVYVKKAIDFLNENKIENTFSIDDLSKLGWSLQFDIKNHSQKIKNGIRKKYGNVRQEYARRFYSRVAKFNNKSIDDLTKIDITNFLLMQKFYNHNVLEWKRKHVVKFLQITPQDDDEIEKYYGLYLSRRYSRASLECKTNGWKNTQKDWYHFNKIKLDFFYRSSWEKTICELFDELLLTKEILSVFIPESITFIFENAERRYFPDIGIIDKNGKRKIFEVKPFSQVQWPINEAKFYYANKLLGDNFKILTENEIFDLEKFRSYIND